MMKTLKKTVLFLCLLTAVAAPANVQAASQKAKAMKAYKNMLSKQTIQWGENKNYTVPAKNCVFATAYIDKDSVPELIVQNNIDIPHWSDCTVMYRYRNGKIQVVKNISAVHRFFYYKKKGVFVGNDLSAGIDRSVYYQLAKGRVSAKQTINKNVGGTGGKWTKYYLGNRQVAKSQFNKSLKKITGARKRTEAKFRKNTAGNRKRYLK